MRSRQELVNTIREVVQEIEQHLETGKFVKEVEKFQLQEALVNLATAEKHLHQFLQVDKERGK